MNEYNVSRFHTSEFSSTYVTIYRYKIGILMKMSIHGKYQFRFAIIIMLLIRGENSIKKNVALREL